jgi:AraC-like DNA-binding protein
MPHDLSDVAPGTVMSWVIVPLSWLLQWALPTSFVDALLRGQWLNTSCDQLQNALLQRWIAESEQPGARLESTNNEIAALELEAMLRRLAHNSPSSLLARRASGKTKDAAHRQIEKLTIFISRNYREEIVVADIARAANLHPNYAMQIFREKCGLSLWDYILRLRVSHAQYLLLQTDRKISDIARDAGFASDSRFYAAFEKYCGTAPRAWRAMMRDTKK